MLGEAYLKSIEDWREEFYSKRKSIIEKLIKKGMSDKEIAKYFEYDNMKKEENDFCPLYDLGEKCHDMENLNCFYCACPNYEISSCKINSSKGKMLENGVLDCSDCIIPHTEGFVSKYALEVIKKIREEI